MCAIPSACTAPRIFSATIITLAAVPGHETTRALRDDLIHRLRYALQAFVASEVSVAVVVLFEAVDVQHRKRQRITVLPRAAKFVGERLVELPAIRDCGQPVAQRQLPEGPVRTMQFPLGLIAQRLCRNNGVE